MERVRDWSMSKEGQNRKASPHSIATERIQNRHRGSGRPLSPATPPDMRGRIGRFSGLRQAIGQPRKTERVEVGERKRDRQGWAVRHTPRAVRTTRRLCGEVLTNPALA